MQKEQNAASPRRQLRDYALITVSVLLMSVGIYFFKFPNHFSFGGISGLSSVVSAMSSLSAR